MFLPCHPPDERELVRQLWNLSEWADTARRPHVKLKHATDLRGGFMLIADVIRHPRLDPFLPSELLPNNWSDSGWRG